MRLGVLGAAVALSAAGCGSLQLPVARRAASIAGAGVAICESLAVRERAAALAPDVLDALAGQAVPEDRAQAQLRGLEGGVPLDAAAVACSVAHLLYDALGGDLRAGQPLEAALLRASALADAKARQAPMTPPRARVVTRAIGYLRDRSERAKAPAGVSIAPALLPAAPGASAEPAAPVPAPSAPAPASAPAKRPAARGK